MERYRDGDPKRESKRTERETRRDESRGIQRDNRIETKRRPERAQRVGGKDLENADKWEWINSPRLDQAEVRQR